MADLKISELNALSGANLALGDELAIVDDSASETKKITVSNLIANGVTLISDDTIPGAKILFGAGDIATAALADSAVTAAKINADAVTSAKIADNTIVNLVSELPASGGYTGQLALDTDDNSLYVWNGTSWLNTKAPASVNAFTDTSAGIINITTSVSGGTATVTASIDDTTAAAQFLAGPVGSAGTVGYRAIDGGDLPTATTTAKGGVVVNGNGLVMDGNTIEIDNSVTQSSVNHLVTYDANGLITGGRVIASSDLPVATTSARGAVIASTGLAVDASGNLSIDNTVTSGTYTKVTVTAQGIVSAGDTLSADDIPDHSAAKLTSGTIGSSLIANDAVTAAKLADQSTVKFGGAAGSDNVTIFPAGDFKGQMFWDETSEDLYIYSGSAFVPITVLSGNLVNAGAYNANTNLMSSVTTAGSSAGFSAGAALPAPAAGNLNHYVVVDTSGTGSGAAPAVALAPPDMLLSQGVGTEYSLIDVSNAIAGQTASNISVVASGNIAATDVQAALQELDTEKLQKSGDTMTGALGIGTASSIVFEGSSADDYETTLTVTDPTADRTITLPNITGTVVTTGDTGSVTSTMITDGTIVNADISSSAEIAVNKLANGTARQLLQTAANGSDVEFTSNVDVPGTLDVTGAATLDSTLTVTGLISADGKVSFPAGTAAAPSLYSGSDTDTGIYSPGSNQLAISTNSTERMRIDSSGLVNVTGGIQVTENVTPTSGSGVEIFKPSSTVGQIQAYNRTGAAWMDFIIKGNTQQFHANGSERMRIDSSGNVGIGATSADANLHIKGGYPTVHIERDSATNYSRLLLDNTANDGGAIDGIGDGVGGLRFSTSDAGTVTERMRIDSSARLLVGTTTTGGASTYYDDLVISNTDSGTGCGITLLANATNGFNAIDFGDTDAVGRGRITYSHADDSLRIDTAGSEQLRIDSSGRLLVGCSSSSDNISLAIAGNSGGSTADSKLLLVYEGTAPADGDTLASLSFTDNAHLTASGKYAAEIKAQRDGGTWTSGSSMPTRLVFSTTANGASSPTERVRITDDGESFTFAATNGWNFRTGSSANTSNTILQGAYGATSTLSGTTSIFIYSNGDIKNTNNSYGAISDAKLKENIVDASSQWDDIKDLRVRNYNFIEGQTHTQIGVVAQEVETVSPGLVTESPDRDEEGNDLGTTTKSVNYSVLYMKAVKALQEAMDRIETLEAKVAALEAA